MAITGKLYGKIFTALWNKEVDFDSDTIKVQLHTNSYTPDQDAHDYKDDLTNEVANGNGYTTGGVALGSKTVTYTGATNKHVLDAADAQWTSATFTFRHAVIVDTSPGSDATRPLIGYQSSDADLSPSNGTVDLVWAAAGIVEITVS